MKFLLKYMRAAAIGAVFLFSPHTQSVSLITVTAWLKCKLGLSMPAKKTITFDAADNRFISFENDLLRAIGIYELPQLYTHWAVESLDSLVKSGVTTPNAITKSCTPHYFDYNAIEDLEWYEKVIRTLELDSDDFYEDACEILVDLLHPENDYLKTDENRRSTIIELFPTVIKKSGALITTDDIENKEEFEYIKSTLHHAVLLTGIFEKIGKDKLINLWKTIVIKANGVELPYDHITNIPVTDDTCTISVTLPIETFAQLLDAEGLRDILFDKPIAEDSSFLIDAQKYLQEHTWIRSAIRHLQQHDSIWNSFIARYINMQVVFSYTFNVREFESDTIRINYLLLSQLNKWTLNPPTVTTRYCPFQTIEIIVNNQDT